MVSSSCSIAPSTGSTPISGESAGSTPIGLTFGSAAEDASIGEMLIIATGSSFEEVDDGMGDAIEFDGGGSCSSVADGGSWKPIVLRGRRRVPLLGLGVKPRESQTML